MASIEKALQIAVRAHEGQKDKDGKPYILHPLRVMNAVEDEPAKIVAVLHEPHELDQAELPLDDVPLWLGVEARARSRSRRAIETDGVR